jgi:hypothetical protein
VSRAGNRGDHVDELNAARAARRAAVAADHGGPGQRDVKRKRSGPTSG